MSEKKVRLVYKFDYVLVNPGNPSERYEVRTVNLGYFEGTEEEAENLCRRLESKLKRSKVPGINENLRYPMIKQYELPKLI